MKQPEKSKFEGRRQDGFTLIELLVVMAVIAILAALLLPSLSRSKMAAQQISCLNRLKQWDLTLTMYEQDNKGFIPRDSGQPSGSSLDSWSVVEAHASAGVWYNALPPEINQPTAASLAANRTNFYDQNGLFQCPTAPLEMAIQNNEADALFSIAMNSKLNTSTTTEKDTTTINVSTIQQPTATVFFLENRLYGDPMVDPKQATTSLGQPSSYANRFTARHLGEGNLAFVDGHAAGFKGDQVVDTHPADKSNEGKAILPQVQIVWTTDPGVSPN